MLVGTVIIDTWVNGGNDSLEKFEASSVWWGGMSSSVINVGMEEVVEVVDTVVSAVGDVVVIVSVGVIEVGETMDVGKRCW